MSSIDKQNLIYDISRMIESEYDSFDSNLLSDKLIKILNSYDVTAIDNDVFDYQTYLEYFLSSKKIEGRSQKTIDRYQYIINKFFKVVNVSIHNITIFHLRNYFFNEKMRGVSDRTLNGIREVLASFFGWLHKEGLLKNNPCVNFSPIRSVKEIRLPFNDTEIERLKENCDSLRDKALICFLLSTGCRISEVCCLNKNDVNFTKLECKVLGKGNKERIVYLNEVTNMLLERYLDSRKDSLDALFVGKGSERMTPGGIRSKLHSIADKAGVENVHPHRFRRTLATNLINHGMSIQEVAKILGHEKIDTTMTYIYIDQENVKNAYKKFSF